MVPDTHYFEPRFNQLDVCLGRIFRLGGGATIRLQVEIQVLDPRVVKFGVDVTF